MFAAAVLVTPPPLSLYHNCFDYSTPFLLQTFVYVLFYQISSSKFFENLGTGFSERKPCSVFFAAALRLTERLFATSEISEHGTHTGVVVVPRMQSLSCKFLRFYSSAVAALRNKMPVLSHSPPALLGGLMANVATPQQAAAAFAGGRFAPLPQPLGRFAQHIALRLCRSAPLRPLHPQPPLRDGLTKLAFCHRSPLFFAAVAAVGRSLRSLRAALAGGTFKPPAAAELCRPCVRRSSGLQCRPEQRQK